MRVSEAILGENRAVINQMLSHRFIADVTADRLPTPVFHRYLLDEGAFVTEAVRIFAIALAKAPDQRARQHLTTTLSALVNQQIPYFEDTLGAVGLTLPTTPPDDPGVRAFVAGMSAIAQHGSYLDIIAAMFAAEWLYATWCSAAAQHPSKDPHLERWVALHAAPEFLEQPAFLAEEIDRFAPDLDRTERARLSGVFGMAMRLEIGFHQAAYRVVAPG